MKRFVFLFAFAVLFLPHGANAASGTLPTSVCSDGNGYHTIYTPHTALNALGAVQTWGELSCNNVNRYHKVELYYYYNSTSEWKRVAYVDHYTTSTYDALVVNQCAVYDDAPHAWQARSYVGGGYSGYSSAVALHARIAADGSCAA